MTAIVIDGCEKSGKTTFIHALREGLVKSYDRPVILRKWTGRAMPNDSLYSQPLHHDTAQTTEITIWDRSWASEFVYGSLLNQNRRLADNSWLGAWLHDRAVQANGLRIMMLGKSAADLAKRRDSSDLPVDPENERTLFREYAKQYGWTIFEGYKYDETSLQILVTIALNSLSIPTGKPLPPYWSGPQDADVVFIETAKSERPVQGGWLPFSGTMSTEFSHNLGDSAINYAWTIAHECPPVYLRNRKVLVACGTTAQLWIANYVGKENSKQTIINMPHPSYLYRFKNERVKRSLRHALSDLNSVLNFQEK